MSRTVAPPLVGSRTRAILLGGLAATCSLLPGAAAHAATSPLLIPPPRDGGPSALAVDRHANAIVVWGVSAQRRSPGGLTIDVVPARSGQRTRWHHPRALLFDTARSAAGDVDVLAQEGSRSPFRLVLFHADHGGRVRRVWSTKVHVPATHAMVARRGSKVAVAWVASRSSRRFAPLHLRLATGDGRGPLRERAVDGVLPSWVDGHLGSVHSADLAIGADGDAVIALTARNRSRRALVLASVDRRGAVRTRQLSRGAEGLVSLRATASGRIGVLVEDTGIEEDFGECINDPTPRRLSASVRERDARTFATLQLLATPPVSCYHTEARILAGPGNRLAIVWGTAGDLPQPPPTVDVALAEVDQGFGAPSTISTGLVLRSAAFGGDALNVAMVSAGELYNPGFGPLYSQRFALGSPGPLQPVDDSAVSHVLSDADPSGVVATAWERGPGGGLLLTIARP